MDDKNEIAIIPEDVEKKQSFGRKSVNFVFDWLETLFFAFCFVVIVFTFLFKVVTVKGPSMNYTLYENQRLAITSFLYTPKRGDIVVIDTPKFDEPIIKRVIAVGGDTVDIDFNNWIVTVTTKDGEIIKYENEPYVNYIEGAKMGDGNIQKYPLYVEEGKIFVMGDNRTQSTDSRAKGLFGEDEIIGKAVFRFYPFNKIGTLYRK